MMFLAVDIGNTQTSFGLFKKDEPFEMTFRFPTATILNGIGIENELAPKLKALGSMDSIAIASVVPNANRGVADALIGFHPEAKLRILSNSDIPILNRYRDPAQTGIDRLLCSLAAYNQYGKARNLAVIVIDLGTATTIDCITSDGEYLGGIIALGVESGAKTLSSIAAQLPRVELRFPEHVLGNSTDESMRSGVLFGAVAMIEGLVARLRAEVFKDQEVIVVATGGLSSLFEGRTSIIDHFAAHLVLEGIAIAASGM